MRVAERAIIDTIREYFPEDGILAEESGESPSSGAACRLMDPIRRHLQLDPWDYAAGRLLVEEAGAVLSDLQAASLSLRTQAIVASNGHIHFPMCAILDQSKAERQ